jgi:hypothetical protein
LNVRSVGNTRTLAFGFAFVAASLACIPARAQNAPQPEVGYVGTGDALIQSTLAGAPLSFSANVAFEERGSRVRLDILSVALQGNTSGLTGALATQLFPAGGLTVVYDRSTSTYTVWSAARHAYFIGGGPSATPTAAPTPTPAPSATPHGDLFGIFGPLRSLKDDQTLSLSVALTGHSTLFGHPVSNVHYAFVRTTFAGDTMDVHGDLAVAEDFNGVPLQLTASAVSKGIPQSSLRIELPQLEKRLPSEADFAPPPGYARVTNIGDAIGGKITPTI